MAVLRLTAACLCAAQVMWIPTARVPIVRFKTSSKAGGMYCDLAVMFDGAPDTGGAAAAWAASVREQYPALRPIVLICKVLLRQNGLADPSQGGLGGYALTIMVAAYLRDAPKEHGDGTDLGAGLAGFLTAFGVHWDYGAVALGVDGPMPLREARLEGWPAPRGRSSDSAIRLAIQDPCRPGSDVGAPSSNYGAVRQLFGDCAVALAGRGPGVARRSDRDRSNLLPLPQLSRIMDLDVSSLPKISDNKTIFHQRRAFDNDRSRGPPSFSDRGAPWQRSGDRGRERGDDWEERPPGRGGSQRASSEGQQEFRPRATVGSGSSIRRLSESLELGREEESDAAIPPPSKGGPGGAAGGTWNDFQ